MVLTAQEIPADSEMCWALSEVIGPNSSLDVNWMGWLQKKYGWATLNNSLYTNNKLPFPQKIAKVPFKKHLDRPCVQEFLLLASTCRNPKGETDKCAAKSDF